MSKITNVLVFAFVTFIIYSCSQNAEKIEEPQPEEVEYLLPIGNKLAGELVGTLKGELMQAINEGGVDNALSVCNVKAQELTKSIADNAELKIALKRTTNKPRNPVNAPDKYEKMALDYFEELVADNKTIPKYYIQKISSTENVTYNYYKPMKMANLCLLCHGTESTMDPVARDKIKDYYPEDMATGYKEGDFRGLIRVKFFEAEI